MTPEQQFMEEFPGWKAFQSDVGRWWASDHHITQEQRRHGYCATVDADDFDGLRAATRDELELRKTPRVHRLLV